jgi:hypothetical protein
MIGETALFRVRPMSAIPGEARRTSRDNSGLLTGVVWRHAQLGKSCLKFP